MVCVCAQLLQSEKDLREVTSVRDFLNRKLSPACEQVCATAAAARQAGDWSKACVRSSSQLQHSAPFVLQLRHVQHICVPFSAKLRAPDRDENQLVRTALQLLHPTPAVCGVPTEKARCTIRTLERFDRGFYAGPFGYLASNGCEFCVAIRSALVRGSQVCWVLFFARPKPSKLVSVTARRRSAVAMPGIHLRRCGYCAWLDSR